MLFFPVGQSQYTSEEMVFPDCLPVHNTAETICGLSLEELIVSVCLVFGIKLNTLTAKFLLSGNLMNCVGVA